MTTTYVDVRKTKVSEGFNVKSKILGVSINEQVENLNKIYESTLRFEVGHDLYSEEQTVKLCWVNPNIRILELPEVDNLEIGYIDDYNFNKHSHDNNVVTLKIPKAMEKLSWSDLSQFDRLNSVWIWDDTHILGERRHYSNVKMLITQHKDGRKPSVCHF